MEQIFDKTMISCLDIGLREIQNSEQTQEIKLPDSMPDIGQILSAWGQPILRGKEWRGDSISFTGGMMVWVLYASEDGTQNQSINAWIPFQMKWELPSGTPEGEIRLNCLTRFVDARSISARKIMVRAGMGVMATAFTPMSVEAAVPNETLPEVELLRSTYPVRLMKEAGEKSFLQDEEPLLPDSAPQPEQLIYYRMEPKVTDRKVLSDKVVFRGSSMLHVLYRGEDGQLYSWDFDLPFSQFAPLKGEYGADAQADLALCPTSVELELDDEGHMRLKCGMAAQYLITDKQPLELVEDAYSPYHELNVRMDTLELPVVLENRVESIYPEASVAIDANTVPDISFLPDFPRQLREGDRVEMDLPGTFQILSYENGGALRASSSRVDGKFGMNAAEDTQLSAVPSVSMVQANAGSGSVQAKGEYMLNITGDTRQRIPMVTGVELGERQQPDPNRPSLILRRAGGRRLWDIAKESGSTMESIRSANGLQGEPVPDQMLLIPVV